MMIIKPHHFMDIIKLYGAGIEHFVPDKAFDHDFYKVANEIIGNKDIILQLTLYGDDICQPCNRFDGKECTDSLDCIKGYQDKETYNKELDTRILNILELNTEEKYTVKQLLQKMQKEERLIFLVWQAEAKELTIRRNDLFQKGCKKLLSERKHTFDDFREIINTLRSENGCPWDRKQTEESMIPHLLEETGEVVDAIRNRDMENLCEELGDVLYQIMLISRIAEEKEIFTIDDVVDGISRKMVRRHPNVFGDIKVNSWEEGMDLWNRIKSEEKSGEKSEKE